MALKLYIVLSIRHHYRRWQSVLVSSCLYICIFTIFILHGCVYAGIASFNVCGTLIWLLYERPAVWEVYPYPLTAVLSCKVSEFSLVISLMFNMLLILLCTLYAFKTRKIPENYNEAKYIAFTMYSTCIVWLAFLPIYFSTKNDYRVRNIFCDSLTSYSILGAFIHYIDSDVLSMHVRYDQFIGSAWMSIRSKSISCAFSTVQKRTPNER